MPLNIKETSPDWFVCMCGNSPRTDGFFPCLMDGTLVEPTPADWDGIHYKCMRCESVYNQDTYDQVI